MHTAQFLLAEDCIEAGCHLNGGMPHQLSQAGQVATVLDVLPGKGKAERVRIYLTLDARCFLQPVQHLVQG